MFLLVFMYLFYHPLISLSTISGIDSNTSTPFASHLNLRNFSVRARQLLPQISTAQGWISDAFFDVSVS